MKHLLLLFTLLSTMNFFAQDQGTIKGNIIDLELGKEPLLFANVSIKDTDWSTQTNLNGNFEMMDIAPGNYMLEISYAGYETLVLPIEVNENGITRIEQGIRAKTVSLGDLTLVDATSKTQTGALASTAKDD